MPDDPLDDLRKEWLAKRDGASGDAYGSALEAEGAASEAKIVYRQMIESGYLIGFYDLAWLEYARGKKKRARKLLREYLAIGKEPDEQTDLVSGVLGHWTWHAKKDPIVEGLLRSGLIEYPDSRSDLADLLRATDRIDEAETLLREGVELQDVGSFIVLGNLLDETGRPAEAEAIYRQGYDAGDAFCAYNLHLLLVENERPDEAREWLTLAAESGDKKAISRPAATNSQDF